MRLKIIRESQKSYAVKNFYVFSILKKLSYDL